VSGCSPIVFVVGAGRPKKSPSLAEGPVFYLKKFVMMADYRTPAPLKIKTFGKKRPQPVGPAAIERAEGQLSTQSRRSLSILLSYAVSYLFIAIVWTNHHYLMRCASAPPKPTS
jgi:hypothetical protein